MVAIKRLVHKLTLEGYGHAPNYLIQSKKAEKIMAEYKKTYPKLFEQETNVVACSKEDMVAFEKFLDTEAKKYAEKDKEAKYSEESQLKTEDAFKAGARLVRK